jgi:hypothetical protein
LDIAARARLFENILDQFANSDSFSTERSPTAFIAYAHDNERVGAAAYDGCVRQLITWLERVKAQIISDQNPRPPFVPENEDTDRDGNIVGSQMCLVPLKCYGAEKPKTRIVDKVIVCGSEVMERYYRKPRAQAYMKDIIQICNTHAGQATSPSLESRIRERVEEELEHNKDDFHHLYTELAFLQLRVSSNPLETHNLVPVSLNQIDPNNAPMQYLPFFQGTDVKLKLNSHTPRSLHKLFFKLLKRLFPEKIEFIKVFQQCYISANEDPKLQRHAKVPEEDLTKIINEGIAQAYHEYHKASSRVLRNIDSQNYTAKLSGDISRLLEDVDQSTQRKILRWLSPISASEIHGTYDDSGTSRVPGTCDWVIKDEKFRRWHDCDGSALLLLKGDSKLSVTT